MLGTFNFNLKFFVDKDSSKYPQKSFDECVSCELALDINNDILISLMTYALKDKNIHARVHNF